MASAKFGTGVPNVYAAFPRTNKTARNSIRRGVVSVTTNASGVATANFPARGILSAIATVSASTTTTPWTWATISSITASAVSVVSVNSSTTGNAVAGTIAVSVVCDFY
jgi:hypothetical protein